MSEEGLAGGKCQVCAIMATQRPVAAVGRGILSKRRSLSSKKWGCCTEVSETVTGCAGNTPHQDRLAGSINQVS